MARRIASIPVRSAIETWARIVQLIAPDEQSAARRDLMAIAGIACSCITDEVVCDDPIVVYGAGPRLRIYALYGDDAVEGARTSESPLSYVPTEGDWHMSIPCGQDDLEWLERSLAAATRRVTVRGLGVAVDGDESANAEDSSATFGAVRLSVDRDAFLRK